MPPRVGQALRKARTDRGVDLSEVERSTKIRQKFLEAMEEDRWDELPAPAYARGFLEIYARYLGLDQQPLLDQYQETVENERHEPIPGSVIKPGTLRQHRPVKRAGSIRRSSSIQWGPVGKVAAGLLAIVIVGLVIVGLVGGSDNGGAQKKPHRGKSQAAKTPVPSAPTTTTSTPPAGQVSVDLRATADVWVCLVDDNGNPVVDGETLTANESRGPFRSASFDATFGNGSIEMTVDDQPQTIPASASPLVYRITPNGAHTVGPSSAPSCT